MATEKKSEKSQIDKDLETLYNRATKTKVECLCPECNKKVVVEVGGDFGEMARAMELRLKHLQITSTKGGIPKPSFFDEKE